MTADVLSPSNDFIDSRYDRLDQTTPAKTASFTHADLQVGFMNTEMKISLNVLEIENFILKVCMFV